jgi:hypothetical protein
MVKRTEWMKMDTGGDGWARSNDAGICGA